MNHYRNRLGILVLLAFQAVLLEAKPSASQQTGKEAVPASNEMNSRKVLDIQDGIQAKDEGRGQGR